MWALRDLEAVLGKRCGIGDVPPSVMQSGELAIPNPRVLRVMNDRDYERAHLGHFFFAGLGLVEAA